ncbi:MAG TPA: diadenylate cyclase CdaA [Anaeromyxobacter sp.]|nr:diadenylate cyclase CdaA [Anaeromyxobacter sp.]
MHSVLTFLIGPGATAGDALLALVDVAVVAFVCYHVLRFIRGTRATAILVGLSLLGLAYAGAEGAGLATLSWLLGHFLSYSFIFGVIVLFQADLRRALAELGRSSRLLRLVARLGQDDRAAQLGVIDAIVKAALELARRRVGALVVVERSADLSDVVGSGRRLDAAVSPELLVAIFQPASPIHDGAAVVQGSRVAAAACLLPLSAAPVAPELGTRHRAAIGLAEEVDAAVVVVSEERGEVSVALDGALHRALDEKALRAILFGAFAGSERGGKGGFLARARARAAPAPAGGGKPRAAI